jgi:hypothetical protein
VALASQGAAYQVVFALTSARGKTDALPIDVFLFQAGRAIGGGDAVVLLHTENDEGKR